MASKIYASTALLLSLNLLLFAMVSSTNVPMAKKDNCSIDLLKLRACADILHLIKPGSHPCCSLIGGLVDLDAACCLCSAIKASVLGKVLNIPAAINLILNTCGKSTPSGFQCS